MIRRWLVLGLLASIAACAPVPRPGILTEVERTRATAAAREAEQLAPQAYLAAEKLRREAGEAARDGDRPTAEILGERALAAYARAEILARLSKAEERSAHATERARSATAEYAALEEQQRRVGAEATDLETRVRVERDAIPLVKSEPTSPERERARLAAARALAIEARLLCLSTSLLGTNVPRVAESFTALDALDAELARPPAHAPIDTAVQLRSACLATLTTARNAKTSAAPEAGAADALLDELGKGGYEPVRDDRGVVVVLRDAFRGGAPSPSATTALTALGQVARAHPEFPVLVVVHSSRGAAGDRDRARADTVAKALSSAGAAHVESRAVGDALPVALPRGGASSPRNERVEVVFVAPTQ